MRGNATGKHQQRGAISLRVRSLTANFVRAFRVHPAAVLRLTVLHEPIVCKTAAFFGFLFFALFVLSMIIFFKYRTRTSLILYYLGFVTLALRR
jgi:hypothetical protein